MTESLRLAHRSRQGHVAGRPDVGSTQHHQQVDRGGPPADPWERLEGLLDFAVIGQCKPVEVQGRVEQRPRDRPAVSSLLPAEPDCEQLGVREAEESLRCQRIGGRLQASEGGQCRRQGNLLLEDDVDERRKPGRSIPQRRRSEPLGDRGQIRIPGGQFSDGRVQRGVIEPVDQATLPRSPNPAAGSGSNGRPSAPRSQALAFSPSDGR
jgi:hypothetical protein